MDIIWDELSFGLPNLEQLIRIILRLTFATLLGAVVGFERERAHKPAGLRTHMLVALGTALFIVACSAAGMAADELSRVIQGLITGIGFIGTGSIIKLDKERHIEGLTTAAGVWMTAAIGVTVGLGSLGIAIISTVFALIILSFIESRVLRSNSVQPNNED